MPGWNQATRAWWASGEMVQRRTISLTSPAVRSPEHRVGKSAKDSPIAAKFTLWW